MSGYGSLTRSITNQLRRVADGGETFARVSRAAGIILVVAVPIVVTPWGPDGYNQVKALTTEILASLAMIGWIGARLATGRPSWRFTAPELPLWAFLLAVLLSSVTSVNPRLSFLGGAGRYEGLFAHCGYVALFLVGVHFFGSYAGLRALVRAAGGAAVITSAYGVLQLFIPPLFAGETFIREWYSAPGIVRVPSTLSSPVMFGGYLSLMIPLLLATGVSARGTARRFWLAAACLALLALAMTIARAAWAATFIGLVILAIAAGRSTWRHRIIVAALAVIVMASVGLLVTGVGRPAAIWSHVTASADIRSGSPAQRVYIWSRTLGLIGIRPWLGWGLETLGVVFPYDRASLVRVFGPRPTIIDRAHNDLLQVAVSIGIPGALAYAAVWGLVVWSAVRTWRRAAGSARILAAGWLAAITAYLVQVQFSFSVVALAPIVWLLAGAAAGWEAESRGRGNGGTRERETACQ
ncbi:MAG: O-antigen ligase family protein [Bacillati bacterium ANGP1]|uniref:O-antigen ligase family protein n=1 Tax=Candidatus Segetimicrobium genomatis TaxID=2569760 RepID=A0A537IUF0_9BACT|nr:MAG: O-antigen ligase family protein [Terrabacteria group bacterium ANGP1]